MREFTLTLNGIDGKKHQINFNDVVFDYAVYRGILAEDICLEIIQSLTNGLNKKVSIIFGNCQIDRVKRFLLNNPIFSEQYFVVNIPAVYAYHRENFVGYFQENFWSLCDLFISQRVRKDNKYTPIIATQDIPSRLPESAKIVWIPNVYFDGYFPQQKTNSRNSGENLHQSGYFPHGDKYVDAFLDRGGGGRHNAIYLNLSNISRRKILFQNLKF